VRAAEDDRVDSCLLERRRVLPDGVQELLAERVVALDQRDEARAGDCDHVRSGVQRAHELGIAAARDGRLGREQSDPPVARREDGGVRLGREDPDDGDGELTLEVGQRRGGRRVARGDDELDPLSLEVARDLRREAADLLERSRPVREPRAVTEVHEVLVWEGDEALVEDGEPAHAGVEHADGTGVHPRDSRSGPGPR
jgi:hypothetical protein